MAETAGDEVPRVLDDLLADRDNEPLGDGALVRYQYVALTPAIGHNRRFVLHDDGRLFGAINSARVPSRPGERFDVALPDEPTATVPEDRMAEVRAALDAVGFFESPRYIAVEGVRDGGASIVTAARPSGTHEVWYVNVDNDLTDLLWSLLGDEPEAPPYDPEQVLADLQRTMEEPS